MNLVLEFFKHNTMMNGRLLDACTGLTTEQIDTTVEGTYGTLGATLVHTANGQENYVARLNSSARPDRLQEDPFPGFDVLRDRLAVSERLLERAAERATESGTIEVTGDDPVGTWTIPADLLLLQVINHGTEHRSQIATMLTQLGVEPPPMDGWTFFFDAGHMTVVRG